jgi:hypothetical protein
MLRAFRPEAGEELIRVLRPIDPGFKKHQSSSTDRSWIQKTSEFFDRSILDSKNIRVLRPIDPGFKKTTEFFDRSQFPA